MRHLASALLLSALATAATGCQGPGAPAGAEPGAAGAPVAAADEKPGSGRTAWIGETAEFGGRAFGERLRISVRSAVDPAIAVHPAKGPRPVSAAGKRRYGVEVALVNVGGKLHDTSRGKAWVTDGKGNRYPAVDSGAITTGLPLEWNTLAVGEQVQGWLVFEVPEDADIVKFHCTLGNSSVTWQLKHPPSR
ncbi:DUF4352 domain-containing protein [Streptomyces sp. NPDC051018]|uniref:DUF4352 domain-containing protein n=1 Tax=Streptomyces sp. NPDC051018 TaxID=3365639 RepID=UPI00378E8C98